ncbi:hypothetical protein KGQ55_01480 [Patescibacteria group bacterium]|nr:hypothetical protein [Patescibacteria group bacterium]
MNPWLDFFAVVSVQFFFFMFLAYRKRAFNEITLGLVGRSVAAGLIFGIAFDLAVGKYLGVFEYALRFEPLFLVLNGALSYGLWMLTIRLLRDESFLSFFAWTIAIGAVYEIADYLYPVWTWTFGGGFLFQESIVLLAAYCGLAMLAAFVATYATRTTFRAFRA